jgi:competence protein ComEA
MAAVVHDGERVFVPTKAAPPAWQPPAGVDTGNVGVLPTRPERGGTAPRTRQERRPTLQGPINVNTATAEDLARLPQIGPSLAQRIVEYRTAHGPFRALQDLDAVPGLGPKTLQAIAPFVSF